MRVRDWQSKENGWKRFSQSDNASSPLSPANSRSDPSETYVDCGSERLRQDHLDPLEPGIFKDIPVLDPDSIGKPLHPTATIAFPIEGARQVLKSADDNLRHSRSFAVETTLSGKNYLRMMLDAHRRGFQIVLVYIGTANVETNLDRIRARVLAGGHDVPEEDVRRRYQRSLANLPIAVKRSDHAILFDNSTPEGYRLIAILSPTGNRWVNPRPDWSSAVA
jgi:predicted ABC-type ATPase